MAAPRRTGDQPTRERIVRDVDTTPDTVSLEEACRRVGISLTLGRRLARDGSQLCQGVTILRFGAANSARPLYRVPVAQLDAALSTAAAS